MCSGCSHPRIDTFDPDGPDYEATAWRCRACEARDAKAKKWREDPNADASGLYFVVQPVGDEDLDED